MDIIPVMGSNMGNNLGPSNTGTDETMDPFSICMIVIAGVFIIILFSLFCCDTFKSKKQVSNV